MASASTLDPAFTYKARSKDLWQDVPGSERAVLLGESRDQDLERYLWAPYNSSAKFMTGQTPSNIERGVTGAVVAFGGEFLGDQYDEYGFDPEGMWNDTLKQFYPSKTGIWQVTSQVSLNYAHLDFEVGGDTTLTLTIYQNDGVNGPQSIGSQSVFFDSLEMDLGSNNIGPIQVTSGPTYLENTVAVYTHLRWNGPAADDYVQINAGRSTWTSIYWVSRATTQPQKVLMPEI